MPQGATGLEAGAWMSEWVNRDTFSELGDRTQENIQKHFQQSVELNGSWDFAHTALFEGLMGGFKSITEFIGQLAAVLAGKPGGTLQDIGEFFKNLIDTIGDAVGDATAAILAALKKLAQVLGIGTGAWTTVDQATNGIGGFINQIGQNASNAIQGLIGIADDIRDAILEMLKKLATAMGLGGVWNTVDNVITTISGHFNTMAQNIADVLNKINAAILDAMKKLATALGLTNVWTTLDQVLSGIGAHLKDVATKVAAVATQIADAILQAFRKLANALGLTQAFANLDQAVAAIAGHIGQIVEKAEDFVFGIISQLADKLGLGDVWDTVEDALDGISDYIVGIFTNTNTVADLVVVIRQSIEDIIKELAKKLGLDKWQEFLDRFLVALGISDKPGTTDLTAAELQALAGTTVANQTLIQSLQAQLTAMGTPDGVSGGDDFETPDQIDTAAEWLARGWVQALVGDGSYVVTDGHEADWKSGAGALSSDKDVARYFRGGTPDANTKTPYQKISRVTGTQVAQNALVAEAVDTLQGRVSADRRSFVEMRASRGGVELYVVTAGNTATLLEKASALGPSVGVAWTLECGAKEGLRVFRILRNGQVVLVHADLTNKTATLDANTGWGFGGISAGTLKPSSVHSVAVADNVPK